MSAKNNNPKQTELDLFSTFKLANKSQEKNNYNYIGKEEHSVTLEAFDNAPWIFPSNRRTKTKKPTRKKIEIIYEDKNLDLEIPLTCIYTIRPGHYEIKESKENGSDNSYEVTEEICYPTERESTLEAVIRYMAINYNSKFRVINNEKSITINTTLGEILYVFDNVFGITKSKQRIVESLQILATTQIWIAFEHNKKEFIPKNSHNIVEVPGESVLTITNAFDKDNPYSLSRAFEITLNKAMTDSIRGGYYNKYSISTELQLNPLARWIQKQIHIKRNAQRNCLYSISTSELREKTNLILSLQPAKANEQIKNAITQLFIYGIITGLGHPNESFNYEVLQNNKSVKENLKESEPVLLPPIDEILMHKTYSKDIRNIQQMTGIQDLESSRIKSLSKQITENSPNKRELIKELDAYRKRFSFVIAKKVNIFAASSGKGRRKVLDTYYLFQPSNQLINLMITDSQTKNKLGVKRL